MNLFVLFFDYYVLIQVTVLKNFIESVYRNYDFNLFKQVTVNTKKPRYMSPVSPLNLCILVM